MGGIDSRASLEPRPPSHCQKKCELLLFVPCLWGGAGKLATGSLQSLKGWAAEWLPSAGPLTRS